MLLVDIIPTDINADVNTDYQLMGPDVTLSTGVDSMTFEISIDPDTDVEDTECFELTLDNPSPGYLDVCHITTTICIKDDDTVSK